jgi:hypothetical protein
MKYWSRLLPFIFLVLGLALPSEGYTQTNRDGIETSIVESGYSVVASNIGKLKVVVAIVVANPFEDKFASRPTVRVTLRASDGSVITTRELSSAGIPPNGRIAFCGSLYADEQPAKVEFRPLSAYYEPTIYRPAEFLPFELLGVRARDDIIGLRVTGEIKNPYPSETGVWITFLYRDAAGKLLGGETTWESKVLAGEPTPFEIRVNPGEISGVKSIDKVVFDHNNSQSSWKDLLRR